MGYYNALHYLEGNTLQDLTATVMSVLNNKMADYGESSSAYYVPTFKAFEGKYDEYLTEPDIHPTETGYEVIGYLFLNQIIPNLEEVETPDTENPIITLNGDNPLELTVGEDYDELGATAEDNVKGDITDQIEISGEVDSSTEGTYEVVYMVSDAAGNQAIKTRIINVVEAAVEPEPEPEDSLEPSDKDESDEEEQVEDDKDNETIVGVGSNGGTASGLPSTATNNPLWIAVGAGLTLLGGALLFIHRRLVL